MSKRERLAQIGAYLCLAAIAAMVVWADDIIKHTEFLR